MTNDEIEAKIRALVKEERRVLNDLLPLINLAEDRKLYLLSGYGSLYDWLVNHFGYSGSAAYRRIQAARLLRAVPEVAEKIDSGDLNLSNIAKAQSAFQAVEKLTGEKLSAETKAEVVEQIENTSAVESERALHSLFPELNKNVKAKRVSVVDEKTSRVAANFPNQTLKKLERVTEVLSHINPGGDLHEIVDYLADFFLERKDPVQKKAKQDRKAKKTKENETAENSTAASVPQRGGSFRVNRDKAIQRANGQCEWTDPKTGKRCNSKHQPEADHIKPKALGGTDDLENLRCLCKRHNLMMAERNLGVEKANEWRKQRPKSKTETKAETKQKPETTQERRPNPNPMSPPQ